MTVYSKGIMAKINMGLSRVNIRINIFNLTFFGMISKTQKLEGISSLRPDSGLHYVLVDSKDDCDLNELIEFWKPIQKEFDLSNIYIVSDKINSYRLLCFSEVSWDIFLIILVKAKKLTDWSFIVWTINRGYATIRTSNKVNRESQKIVAVLESYYIEPPTDSMIKIEYETGVEKRGINIILGGKQT